MKRKNNNKLSVEELIKNFHEDFESGLSIPEIADKYKIDKSYIYRLLEKIATLNGVDRSYYLKKEHSTHNITMKYDHNNSYNHYDDEMFIAIDKKFEDLQNDISDLCAKLKEVNNKYKDLDSEMEMYL